MPELFDRAYVLEVGNLKIDGSQSGTPRLRIAYSIERNDSKYPNTADIQIYNLTRDHAKELANSEEVSARLAVGYVENCQTVFFGTFSRAITQRNGPDLITTLHADDGKCNAARFRKSYGRGALIGAIVADLAAALGLDASAAVPFLATAAPLTQARTLAGAAFDLLSSVLSREGYTWTIQDGAIFLVSEDIPPAKYVATLLTPQTGLLGTVDVSKDDGKTTIKGAALSLPELRPGDLLSIASEGWTGAIRVKNTTHAGDFLASDWTVEFEGIPI